MTIQQKLINELHMNRYLLIKKIDNTKDKDLLKSYREQLSRVNYKLKKLEKDS